MDDHSIETINQISSRDEDGIYDMYQWEPSLRSMVRFVNERSNIMGERAIFIGKALGPGNTPSTYIFTIYYEEKCARLRIGIRVCDIFLST